MVSIGPYSESYNYRFMFDFNDLRGPPPKQALNKGSIMDALVKHFPKYAEIVEKADLQGIYNDAEANLTLFVVPDNLIRDSYMKELDRGLATRTLNYLTLNRKIDKTLLTQSPISQFNTRHNDLSICVTTVSGKTVVERHFPVEQFDVECTNGMIHIISGGMPIPVYP